MTVGVDRIVVAVLIAACTCPGARAGSTGCTRGWRRPARPWTPRWCGAARSALELAACGLLDPATSLLLAGAAHEARAAGEPNELAESDLTRALRAALGQPGFRAALAELGRGDELLAELEAAAHQVFLARRFYNDAVAVTRDARRRWLVRMLRLAGGAPLPEFFEIDDSLVTGGAEGSGADMLHFTSGEDAPGPVA